MKKILTTMVVIGCLFMTVGCMDIGDTTKDSNHNNDNSIDNSVDNSTSNSSGTDYSTLEISIEDNLLTCIEKVNNVSGIYTMYMLEYNSATKVQEISDKRYEYKVDFVLSDDDKGKSLSCSSEYEVDGSGTKTNRSETLVY